MATHLDLEEQEQLDQVKHFWKQYGNLITWTLIAALAVYAGFNGWNWWQREQGLKAGALYEELDRAAQAGDVERASRAFDDLKERYPRALYAQQGGLLAAKVQFEKGRAEEARASLAWVADGAREAAYRTAARLRLAGLLLDAKQYDQALAQLAQADAKEFQALVADRRGDILLASGNADAAKAAYREAWQGFEPDIDYRRLVEAKLIALGAAPAAPKTAP